MKITEYQKPIHAAVFRPHRDAPAALAEGFTVKNIAAPIAAPISHPMIILSSM
jgi:hypothetical protein